MLTPDAANEAIVSEVLEAWKRRDTDAIAAAFTEDAVYHLISIAPFVGREAIRGVFAKLEDSPPARSEILHQIASANVVMTERVDHVWIRGLEVDMAVCGVFEISEGRIARWTEYYDSAPLRQQ
jgi:limonene-1,2-epoxide hydrolase